MKYKEKRKKLNLDFIIFFSFSAESVMAGFVKKCPCLRPPTEEIHVLDYRHNSLSDLPTEVFNLERTLEELYVDNNQLRDLPRVRTILSFLHVDTW